MWPPVLCRRNYSVCPQGYLPVNGDTLALKCRQEDDLMNVDVLDFENANGLHMVELARDNKAWHPCLASSITETLNGPFDFVSRGADWLLGLGPLPLTQAKTL